jgi:tetratricopeptide (TPR) repeat protein
MKKQSSKNPEQVKPDCFVDGSFKAQSSLENRSIRHLWNALAIIATLTIVIIPVTPPAVAQNASPERSDGATDGITIRGTVLNSSGNAVEGASVRIQRKGVSNTLETNTNAAGAFMFSSLQAGSYILRAETSGQHSHATAVTTSSQGDQKQVDLVLDQLGKDSGGQQLDSSSLSSSSTPAMEFADKPNFTVAGVTDWTAVGGHGSDSSLRTSEALTRETLTLKPEIEKRSAAVSSADLHRLAGERDEKQGDPLAAVHEFEQAVRLDPNEQNYFEWGSELLLHRAVWQAQEVFGKGADAYPKSARMLAALGTALFASARYDEAALRLCNASDLNPADPEPYMFMGRIEMAAPNPLPCIEKKLARFVQEQPENSLANYFYAMAIWKRQQQPAELQTLQQVETLLTRAVTIDAKCGDAYLQLGIIKSTQHDFGQAIGFYTKAIEASPQLGDAHYRLGMAYDRIGEHDKAKQQLQLHDEIEKQQTATIENQRREVKQFLVVLDGQPKSPQAH